MHGLGGLTEHETTCTVNYWIVLLFLPVTFLSICVFVLALVFVCLLLLLLLALYPPTIF